MYKCLIQLYIYYYHIATMATTLLVEKNFDQKSDNDALPLAECPNM